MAKNSAIERAQTTRTNLDKLREHMGSRLKDVATEHLTPERLLRLVGAEYATNNALQNCSIESLAASLLLASQLGLEPGGPLGHLYLVPYGKACTPIVGYKGMLQLIRNTGEIRRISAHVFYRQEMEAGDIEISVEPPEIIHRWTGESYSDADIAGAYCVVEGHHGERYLEIVSRAEIDARRKRSAAGGKGPWSTDFAAMARKCAVRKLFGGGTVPVSVEKMAVISKAMEEDGDSGAQTSTSAARNIALFRVPATGKTIETEVHEVEPTATSESYDRAMRIAVEMGATQENITAALDFLHFDAIHPSKWGDADEVQFIAELEAQMGA